MLELWGMQIIHSLSSLPVPFWPEVVAPYRGLIRGLDRTKMCAYTKVNSLK